MTTSPYKITSDGERNLVEELFIESIKVRGEDYYYIPREVISEDFIFNEDKISEFKNFYQIEMKLENVQEFGGDGDLFTKFGYTLTDSGVVTVSRKRFEEEIPLPHPREGDLVYFPLTSSVFEITFVEDENPFYQLGKLYSYMLTIELFRYGNEEFDTGIDEIDDFMDVYFNDDNTDNDNQARNDQAQQESDQIVDNDNGNPFGGI